MTDAALETLVRRCAWCERIWDGDGWVVEPPAPRARETSTICTLCVEHLRAANLSH